MRLIFFFYNLQFIMYLCVAAHIRYQQLSASRLDTAATVTPYTILKIYVSLGLTVARNAIVFRVIVNVCCSFISQKKKKSTSCAIRFINTYILAVKQSSFVVPSTQTPHSYQQSNSQVQVRVGHQGNFHSQSSNQQFKCSVPIVLVSFTFISFCTTLLCQTGVPLVLRILYNFDTGQRVRKIVSFNFQQ